MKNDARKKNALEFIFCGSCLYKIYIPKHSLSIDFFISGKSILTHQSY